MALQSHMNYFLLMMNSLFQRLNLHWFYRSLSIMVCELIHRPWSFCVQFRLLSISLICFLGFAVDNTGGLLFKIYIVGETIKVVRRFSLPNISKRELSKVAGVFRFPRVSCAAASADDADLDPNIAGETTLRPPSQKVKHFFKSNSITFHFSFFFFFQYWICQWCA